MAVIFLEGFDKYGPIGENTPDPADLMAQGQWTSHGASPSWNIVAGLSKTGTAFQYGSGTDAWVSKTLPNNYSRLIGGFRFKWMSVGAFGPLIQFQDVSTPQISVRLEPDGTFTILRNAYQTGVFGGVILETSTYSITEFVAHYLEFDITFGSSANYAFWIDGVAMMSGTANTISTAHSYANVMVIGNNSGFSSLSDMIYDDLYLFDNTGSANDQVLLTNPRIETRFPNADVQTEFANVATILGGYGSATGNTTAAGANTLFLRKFTSDVDQTVTSVSCIPAQTSGSAKFAAVLYADNAGVPDALISDGVEVIGTTANAVLTSNLTVSQAVTTGTAYWIGFIANTSLFLQESDADTTLAQKASNTYASGAPDPAPTMTVNQPNWLIWGNCIDSATNWNAVDSNPTAGNYSCIASDNPGDEDLYDFPPLTAVEADIYCVAVKGTMKRSDSGARTIDLRLKSGATDDPGSASGFTAGTSFEWKDTYFDQDPDGSTDWTLTSANAIEAGPKIAS